MTEDNPEGLPPDNQPDIQGAGIMSGDGIDSFEEKNDLDKIFEKMLDPKNIYHFTELNANEITGFSTLGVIAEKYMPTGVVHGWLLKNLMMRVSKQRKGKGEFVKITARNAYQEPAPQQGGWNPFRR